MQHKKILPIYTKEIETPEKKEKTSQNRNVQTNDLKNQEKSLNINTVQVSQTNNST